MSTDNILELLRQGIEAAKAGNRAGARQAFERVVDIDPQNEKGWFWLASVVDTDEERKICLDNVLQINPANEKARASLEKIDLRLKQKVETEEVVAGVSRKQITMIIGGAIALVAVIAVVLMTITVNNNNMATARTNEALQTQSAGTAIVIAQTGTSVQETAVADAATQTQIAIASPTPTPSQTPDRATLPPEWTPTPLATLAPTQEALPPPQGVSGVLVAWGGRDELSNGFYPVGYFNLDSGMTFNRIGNEIGREVDIFPNGQRIVYARYNDLFFETLLEAVNLSGTGTEVLSQRFRTQTIFDPSTPRFARDAENVVFVGRGTESQGTQLYILSLLPAPEGVEVVRRLSNDDANYLYPAISPDGSRIVVVRNDPNAAILGPDIDIFDMATGSRYPLTSDYGQYLEMSPIWSHDGSQVIYAAAEAATPNNHDIVVRNISGGTPSLIIRDPADDIYPVISPDGQFLAFSSNRDGNYDIYIYNFQTQTLAQLTNGTGREAYFAGGWWQP